MKTAEFMRSLMPGDIDKKVKRIVDFIEYSAKHGEGFIYCNYAHPFDTDLWVMSNGNTPDWTYARDKLTELGFSVTYKCDISTYRDHPAATVVDKGTVISWT